MSQESKKQTAVEWLFAHLLPHLDWSKADDKIDWAMTQVERTVEKNRSAVS